MLYVIIGECKLCFPNSDIYYQAFWRIVFHRVIEPQVLLRDAAFKAPLQEIGEVCALTKELDASQRSGMRLILARFEMMKKKLPLAKVTSIGRWLMESIAKHAFRDPVDFDRAARAKDLKEWVRVFSSFLKRKGHEWW
jgi:hypothetical protein